MSLLGFIPFFFNQRPEKFSSFVGVHSFGLLWGRKEEFCVCCYFDCFIAEGIFSLWLRRYVKKTMGKVIFSEALNYWKNWTRLKKNSQFSIKLIILIRWKLFYDFRMQLKDNRKRLGEKKRFQLVSHFRTWLCLFLLVHLILLKYWVNRKASLCAHYLSRSLVLLTILTFNHGIYQWAVLFPLFFEGKKCYIQFKYLHQVVNSCQYYTRGL